MQSRDELAREIALKAVQRSGLRALGVLLAQAVGWRLALGELSGWVGEGVGYAAGAGALYFTFCALQFLDDLSLWRAVLLHGDAGDRTSNLWSYRCRQRLGDGVFFPLLFVGGLLVAGGAAWVMLQIR